VSATRIYIEVPDDDAHACAGALSRAVAAALQAEASPDERWLLRRVQLIRVEHDPGRAALSRARRELPLVAAAWREVPGPGHQHAVSWLLHRFEAHPLCQWAALTAAWALYRDALKVFKGGPVPRYLERQRRAMELTDAWLRRAGGQVAPWPGDPPPLTDAEKDANMNRAAGARLELSHR